MKFNLILAFRKKFTRNDKRLNRYIGAFIRTIFLFLRKLYVKPLKALGLILGVLFSRAPIVFSSQLKEALNIVTRMEPSSLGVRVVVDRKRDISRSQFCYKETYTCDWIREYYKKGDTIYDVGANIGAVSLLSASYLDRNCCIYAFEVMPSTFNALFQNIMINNYNEVITPLNIALSDKVSLDQLYLRSIESGTSGHSISAGIDNDDANKETLNVLTQTLDNLVHTYNMERPNHIKIDIDGLDYEVLLGGERSIFKDNTLKTVLIEKNHNEDKIRDFLKEKNFIEINLEGKYGKDCDCLGFVHSEYL